MEAEKELIDELKLQDEDEVGGSVEDLSEESDYYDMDKMWDGLHFLLVGQSTAEHLENNPLSAAIVGAEFFCDTEGADYITYIEPEMIPEICEALSRVDIDAALETFSGEKFAENEIYPDIWTKEEPEELKEELREAFEGLKEFYETVSENGNGVIVSIY
jgi:hypothetical protein